jgi:acetyl-CoA carboxylase biotin carboxyl carrier protein
VNLSNEDVQDILSLLDSLPYAEITLETSRFTLRLRRSAEGGWTQEAQVLPRQVPEDPALRAAPVSAPAPVSEPAPPGEPRSPAGPAASSVPGADVRDIVSPLPGTFYRAPQPGAPPFADVGGRVEPGTVVAIIETMKLMNPVYAGTAGTVTEICLDDGEFAEQGSVLMRVSAGAG